MNIRNLSLAILVFSPIAAGRTLVAADTAVIQWKDPTKEQPWLSRIEVAPYSRNLTLQTAKVDRRDPDYPNGVRLTLAKEGGEAGWIQVRLAQGYGFLISDQMLDRHPYLWVRDMGIYISRLGTWAETAGTRERNARTIGDCLKKPFVSCAEKYFQWTGFLEHERGLDQKIWDFVKEKQEWPLDVRAVDHIAAMPEVDAAYFTERFPDLKYSRVYLGWPDHNDEFILWNNGKIGISSRSVGGDPRRHPETPWQPRARGFTFQFGVGDAPRFREYGDDLVKQSLQQGYQLIVDTEWNDGGVAVRQTNFAYPLESETIKSGVEPLLAWTRLRFENQTARRMATSVGIEFTDEDFGGNSISGSDMSLPNLSDLAWRAGGFFILGELVLAADPALTFEEIPTTKGRKRFRAPVELDPAAAKEYDFAGPYRPLSPARLAEIRALGYARAHERTLRFWNEVQTRGASIAVPDALFNNLHRTFLPRIMISSDLDLQGRSVLQTGPIVYNRVWHHVTSYAVADYLSRLGHFDLARKYLEPYFDWQGIPAPDSPAIANWEGFFGAPPEQCPWVWLMYQGMIQWASARYYELSGDRAWLDAKLPALLKSMDWVKATRGLTKKLNPDGTRPLNYGWFPPGRVTDGSHGTSIFSDANIWRGMDSMARVLDSLAHPRASEFRTEANDYRSDLQDGLRRAAAERALVRLNDDTWVPYLPAYLEKDPAQMETTRWYAAVVDGPWQGGMLDAMVFPPGSPENWWLVNFFEDTYSPMNPSLSDEPFWACHTAEYLSRDRIHNFLYTLYSQSTTTLARETLTTYEHRSHGKGRVFELTGWAAGYWCRNFTDMLARTVGSQLWLLQATPRRWLRDGESIRIEKLQTEFGPLTCSVTSSLESGTIRARINVPDRRAPELVRIRFRVPDGKKIRAVTINSRQWRDFDSGSEWVEFPGSFKTADIVVSF